ncbi:MAG: hypothetical protein AAFZ52_12940 [Bacteroidota bacterium]
MATSTTFSLPRWLGIGILLEILLFGYCYLTFDATGEVFRHAARYSGRLSLLIYLLAAGYFVYTQGRRTDTGWENLRVITLTFSILHLIHFGFLATNVVLNDIELIPVKLAGGALGYGMIVAYPWVMRWIKRNWMHLIYFSYVGLVMAVTYLARIKGDFPGATPGPVHYAGISLAALAVVAVLAAAALKPSK